MSSNSSTDAWTSRQLGGNGPTVYNSPTPQRNQYLSQFMSSSMLQDATKQASAVTVTTIKAFTRKSVDITQGNLDRCIEWADEHVRQGDDNEIVFTPMLIFNEEMQGATKTYRKIQAREVKSFLESVHMRNQPLFLHEIAPEDAPIKLAFDIELDFTKKETVEASFQSIDEQLLVEQCNEFCSMLISRCLVLLSQFAGRILDEHGVYQTDCTRKGKFSRHLTFDCSDVEHSSVVFVSDAHCAAFVDMVLQDEELQPYASQYEVIIDRGIYDTRHPLRTYFSAKRSATHQMMRYAPDGGTCDAEIMAKCLRTCFIVRRNASKFYRQGDQENTLYITSLFGMHEPNYLPDLISIDTANPPRSRARRRTTNRTQQVGQLVSMEKAILECGELAPYAPTRIIYQFDKLIVKCNGVKCSAHVDGQHREDNPCVFIKVNLLTQSYVQLCHSSTCAERRKSTPAASHSLPIDVAEEVRRYLNSRDWEGATPIGADFILALGTNNK